MNTFKKLSITVLAVVAVVIIIGATGTYYLALQNSITSPLPSTTTQPIETAAPSASETPQPTAKPTILKVGEYANYTVRTYQNGTLTSEYPITWVVNEADYNNTDVLVIIVTAIVKNENSTTTTIMYWYQDKITYDGVAMKTQTLIDGELVSEYETEHSGPAASIDPQTIVGQETITVSAGTFSCDKIIVADEPTNSVTTQWYSDEVPVAGLVKMETYEGDQLTLARELVAYNK